MKRNKKITHKDKTIKLIKSNLKRKKFTTQSEIIEFLNERNHYVSQSNISNYLKENNIRKNHKGYYEDMELKEKKYFLKKSLIQSNANIFKPCVYGNILPEYENSDNEKIYVAFISLNHGFENRICELIFDYVGHHSIYCQPGYGCIQIFSSSEDKIKKIYSGIAKLSRT